MMSNRIFNDLLPADRKVFGRKEILVLNKINKYAIAWRLQTAKKPETREKRMKQILEMMAKKEKLY